MKIVVIGCTHAGTSAVTNMRKLYPNAEITVYEINDNVSFLSCGIALHVGGVVPDADSLFYSSPQQLISQGINIKVLHEVVDINPTQKSLSIKNLDTNDVFTDSYDRLVITTGSWPITPPIEGINLDNIVLCKNYNHSKVIIEQAKHAERITVVGGGYIGIELVEAFEMSGKKVTLIDSEERILNRYLDATFTTPLEKEFHEKGVTLALNQTVTKFTGTDGKVSSVITTEGEYESDLVIMCVGFRPNTTLFTNYLETLPNGAIVVNEFMQTSEPSIYSAGDCCAVIYNPTEKQAYIPLATNAVRMGTLVAYNIFENKIPYMGTQGTSGIKIYDYNIAATGLTEQGAVVNGLQVDSVLHQDNDRPEFMPSFHPVTVKIVFDVKTREIVGGQIMSTENLTQMINTLSVCIQNKMTIDQLAFVDFFFQPHYSKPWNLLNAVGLKALQ